MFGINLKSWPLSMKRSRGTVVGAPAEDRAAMQDCARQEFVDTRPMATYIVAEFRPADRRPALEELAV